MKNVLIIAYHFPPRGGIAVKRTLKFIKNLPLYGWNPIVLTTRQGLHEYKMLDETLLDELPDDLCIYRTEHFRKRLFLKKQVKKIFAVKNASGVPKKISKKKIIDIQEGGLKNFLISTGAYFRPFIPDVESGWNPFAVKHGKEIIYKDRIDALYTTSPPHSTQLIGLALSKQTGLPWVADFRDDWITNPLFAPTNRISAKLHTVLEERVVRKASKIVVTNRHTKESFLRKHPFCGEDKVVVIPNGYDLSDFAGIEEKMFPRFTIVHNGGLGTGLTARYFFSALRALIDEHPEFGKDVEVRFAGGISKKDKKTVKDLELDNTVVVQRHMPYKDCIKQLVRSHLFLLFLTAEAGGSARTPAKLYDYIAAGRPVLGMIIEGDAADKIREMHLGSVVHPSDVEGIKIELNKYYQKYKKSEKEYLKPVASPEEMLKYDQSTLTRQLATLLSGENGH